MLQAVRGHVRSFNAAVRLLLSAGLVLALGGVWVLSWLIDGVADGETERIDQAALAWMHANSGERWNSAALEVTALGDTLVVLTIAGVAGSLLYLLGRRGYAVVLAAAVVGAALIATTLKAVIDRPRPLVPEWHVHYVEVSSSSFPSGHATMSTVLFLVLAYVIHRLALRSWVTASVLATAGCLILLVGLSRVYLGVHYVSDIVAGFIVGFAWAVLCALVGEMLPHFRRHTASREAEARR